MGKEFLNALAARFEKLEFNAVCSEIEGSNVPYIGHFFLPCRDKVKDLLGLLTEAQGVHQVFGDTAEKHGKSSQGQPCASFTFDDSFLKAYGRSLKLFGDFQEAVEKHLKRKKSAAKSACEGDKIRQVLLLIKNLRGSDGQPLAQVFKKGVSWECDESTPEIKLWNRELRRLMREAGFKVEISHHGTSFKVPKPKGKFKERYYDLIDLEDKYKLYELLDKYVLRRAKDASPPSP